MEVALQHAGWIIPASRTVHAIAILDGVHHLRAKEVTMSKSIANYDGGIVTTPQQVVRPTTVETLQEIMRDTVKYPGPVRAMGSYHSLTPCASSTGTIVDMDGLKSLRIDAEAMTITAQAGVQLVDAAAALRKLNLQFMLNIEIGNITLGSAACCHTKDSLDGVELGQVNSYLVAVKWVSPSGSLEEASTDRNPDCCHSFGRVMAWRVSSTKSRSG